MFLTASAGSISTVTSALTTGLSDVGSEALNAIASVVPGALVVMGAGLVIGIGIKAFKKVTGR